MNGIVTIRALAVFTISVACVAVQCLAGDWPCWRGPASNGVSDSNRVPTAWSAQEHIGWKTQIEGAGNSSPCVSADSVIVTSATMAGNDVKGTYVVCLDRATGAQRWKTEVPILGRPKQKPHDCNGWATPTAASNGKRIAVVFATGTMACLDMTGKLIWTFDLGPLDHCWGLAASPAIDRKHVYYSVDQEGAQPPSYVIAIDLASGRQAWRTDAEKSGGRGYSSPVVFSRNGRSELLVWADNMLTGYDTATGKRLWKVSTFDQPEPIATPMIVGDTVYLAQSDRGMAIKVQGAGKATSTKVIWSGNGKIARMAGSMVYKGRLYAVSDPGDVSCYDARTGGQVWTAKLGVEFRASPVAAADRVIFVAMNGKSYVIKAGDAFERIGENSLPGSVQASPAISDGTLYVRTMDAGNTTVWCIAAK